MLPKLLPLGLGFALMLSAAPAFADESSESSSSSSVSSSSSIESSSSSSSISSSSSSSSSSSVSSVSSESSVASSSSSSLRPCTALRGLERAQCVRKIAKERMAARLQARSSCDGKRGLERAICVQKLRPAPARHIELLEEVQQKIQSRKDLLLERQEKLRGIRLKIKNRTHSEVESEED